MNFNIGVPVFISLSWNRDVMIILLNLLVIKLTYKLHILVSRDVNRIVILLLVLKKKLITTYSII